MKICLTLYVQIISMHGRHVVIILFMQNMNAWRHLVKTLEENMFLGFYASTAWNDT